jgi:hypothetical protein
VICTSPLANGSGCNPSRFEPLTLETRLPYLCWGIRYRGLFHCGADVSKPNGRAGVEVIIKRMGPELLNDRRKIGGIGNEVNSVAPPIQLEVRSR